MSKSFYLSNTSLKEKTIGPEQLYHTMVIKELMHQYISSFSPVFLYARELPYPQRVLYFRQCRKFLEHLEAALNYEIADS